MNDVLAWPWLEFAIATALIGSLVVAWIRAPERAAAWGIGLTGLVFAATFLAGLGVYLGVDAALLDKFSLQYRWFGKRWLSLDELSAPLVPAVALLHFMTALATARTRMRRFSFSWSLAADGLRLAVFSCQASWLLVALLSISTIPPYIELVNRKRPTRVYVLHMALFVGLLILGWLGVETRDSGPELARWATLPLMMAILIRCGTVPAHCWVTDWFEHASFGNALLLVAPLSGVYAAVRLVLPVAPNWVLQGIGAASLVTAVYAAAMAIVQTEARRFFAYLFLSHAAVVLVGMELHTSISLTGSLCLWFSIVLSLGGFGLTLRALESRVGRLSLSSYHGLYEQSPALAVCFLLTGLASVGFPGTLGFVSSELLIDGAIHANLYVGLGVVLASALNGIAVMRAYFRLFTGARHVSTVSLALGARERFAVLVLSALILAGGLYPQPGVASRQRAAEALLAQRGLNFAEEQDDDLEDEHGHHDDHDDDDEKEARERQAAAQSVVQEPDD